MTIVKTIQINVEADKANSQIDKFDKNLKETDSTVSGMTGTLDKMTGGAVSGFTKVGGVIKTTVAGFKSLKIAIAATGIGLLVIAIGALYTAFKSSEEGQNKFTKLMGQIGVVTGNVIDIIADLGEAIFAAGKALVKLATGDLKGASAAWGEFKENVNEATTAIKNFGSETKKELAAAREIADMRAKATLLNRDLIVDIANAERDVADLREKAARKDLYNAAQRKGFLLEAQAINDRIAAQQIESARLNYEAIKSENELSKSTIEAKDAEAEAKAELIRLDTARLMKNKEMSAQISEINNAEIAEIRAKAEEKRKAFEDELAAREEFNEKILELSAKDAEDKYKQDEENFARQIELENKYAADKLAVDIATNIQRVEDEKKAAEEKIRIEEMVKDAKFDIANNTMTLIGSLAKEGGKLAKGVAVAQAIMNSYQGITSVLAAPSVLPEPIGSITKIASAVGIGAMGFANVKKILATKEGSSSSGSAGGSGGAASVRSSAPSFNLVKGTGTNQIADSLSKANSTPVKAYVVSSEVTTGQSLDRKIVTGASL